MLGVLFEQPPCVEGLLLGTTRLLASMPNQKIQHGLNWLLCGIFLFVGCETKHVSEPASDPPVDFEQGSVPSASPTAFVFGSDEKERVSGLLESQDYKQAAQLLQPALLALPNDVELLFLAARATAGLGRLDEAVSLLSEIPNDHPTAGLAALGQSADWCLQLEKFSEAEARYLRIVEMVPWSPMARRQLAWLYNRQGRRHEAARQIRWLCRIGDIREGELQSLISLADAIFDKPDELPTGRPPVFPIGVGGQARIQFTQRNYLQTVKLLEKAVESFNVPPAISALYGRCLAESQQHDTFVDWINLCSDETKEFAEYWSALGAHLIDRHQHETAVRALAEALLRDPSDRQSTSRMTQTLLALGKNTDAKRWQSRSTIAYRTLMLSNRIVSVAEKELQDYHKLAEKLEELGRPLEAVLWKMIAVNRGGRDQAEIQKLKQQHSILAKSEDAFGSESERLCGLGYTSFPLPTSTELLRASLSTSAPAAQPDLNSSVNFQNVAKTIGLEHQFNVASQSQKKGFAIYQQYGGGVAVLDFDLDGYPDLYFAQGGSDPPEFKGKQSNLLYRNVGDQLLDVTLPSQSTEHRYSIGVSAGDQNQDGFNDLFVTNVGRNTMFINQGDGTFREVSLNEKTDKTYLHTSMALADVTGDALPDLVELCFAHDKAIADKPSIESGIVIDARAPLDFRPGSDRLLVNDGEGGWIDQRFDTSEDMRSTGLGVIVSNFDSDPGCEVFVGNDTRFDHLWKKSRTGWENVSHVKGCAFQRSGTAIASMGIATADFDRSGTSDLFITNFENEPNALFLNRGGFFNDRTVHANLATPSVPYVGFGTQAIDFNRNGEMDLLVTNGHIEDYGTAHQPFKQLPQAFTNRGGGAFEVMKVTDPSGYFSSTHVGRALARLDFNVDGKTDAVITHLGSPSALLLNQSQSNHHWLDVRLVGTTSERDAIGSKVTVHAGANQWSQWSTAGDGYLCRNEQLLSFGLGSVDVIEKVIVEWPNGQEQSFHLVPTDKRVTMVQDQVEIWIP